MASALFYPKLVIKESLENPKLDSPYSPIMIRELLFDLLGNRSKDMQKLTDEELFLEVLKQVRDYR